MRHITIYECFDTLKITNEACESSITNKEADELYRYIENQNLDKFNKLNKIDKIIKKLMACSINISNNDFGKIQTGLKDIEFIKGVKALPCFASEYDKNVGFKKCNFIKNPFS